VRALRVDPGPRGKPAAATATVTFSTVLDPRAALDPARWRVTVDGKPVEAKALSLRLDATAKKVAISGVPAAAGAKVDVTSRSARGADGAERTTPSSRTATVR
jgi:hypothetical protein